MTTKLTLFNDSLLLCGERFLASLTEEREPRRLLDQVYDSGGIKACLEAGQWNFAMRSIQIDYDSGISPGFGYRRGFVKPTDWVLTSALCSDEYFRAPVNRYWDEAGYWYSDLDTMYVRYVSNDATYGMDFGKWPESFREYVAEYFANRIIRKITDSEEEEAKSDKRLKKKLLHAKNRAAMADPTMFPAPGGWVRARGGWGGRNDGGNGGSLIG
jgi:hypothetical protein